jgi:hypothetical protein
MAQAANFLLYITARTRSNRVKPVIAALSWPFGNVADGRNSAIAAPTRPANEALGMDELAGICRAKITGSDNR